MVRLRRLPEPDSPLRPAGARLHRDVGRSGGPDGRQRCRGDGRRRPARGRRRRRIAPGGGRGRARRQPGCLPDGAGHRVSRRRGRRRPELGGDRPDPLAGRDRGVGRSHAGPGQLDGRGDRRRGAAALPSLRQPAEGADPGLDARGCIPRQPLLGECGAASARSPGRGADGTATPLLRPPPQGRGQRRGRLALDALLQPGRRGLPRHRGVAACRDREHHAAPGRPRSADRRSGHGDRGQRRLHG